VNTDHGFLLGEHEAWGKCAPPFYGEVAHTPLFVWDPRCRAAGVRRRSLVQTIDLAPSLLDYFGVEIPPDMQGRPLARTTAANVPVREAGLFGAHGHHVNCTDGRYVYMRAPVTANGGPLFEYTLMPTHMRRTFSVEEMKATELAEPFSFTKGCRIMKIATRPWFKADSFGNALYDLAADPGQEHPIDDPAAEQRMIELMVALMRANDAPPEQFERLGLPRA
jgi:arylsulfatase A-like enzyme